MKGSFSTIHHCVIFFRIFFITLAMLDAGSVLYNLMESNGHMHTVHRVCKFRTSFNVENKIFRHRMEGVKITSRKIYYVQSWNILSLALMLFRYYYYFLYTKFPFDLYFSTSKRSAFHANSMLTWGRISCNTFFQMHCSDSIWCLLSFVNRKKNQGIFAFLEIAWIRARTKIFHLYYHVYHTHLRLLYHLMYTNAHLTLTLMSGEWLMIIITWIGVYMLCFR